MKNCQTFNAEIYILLTINAGAQQAVCQNGGLVSSEVLFNFASVWLVPAAVETRHFGKLLPRWLQCGRQCGGTMKQKIER